MPTTMIGMTVWAFADLMSRGEVRAIEICEAAIARKWHASTRRTTSR
jgi:hypothetical protein